MLFSGEITRSLTPEDRDSASGTFGLLDLGQFYGSSDPSFVCNASDSHRSKCHE